MFCSLLVWNINVGLDANLEPQIIFIFLHFLDTNFSSVVLKTAHNHFLPATFSFWLGLQF